MSDEDIAARVENLVAEEHQLRSREEADAKDTGQLEEDQRRLRAGGVELDRCLELLRPRRAVRELVTSLIAELRSTSHRIVALWHVDDVWIAEVEASYELRDWLRVNALPRAYVVREGPDGIRELHAYGAHERPLTEHRTGAE